MFETAYDKMIQDEGGYVLHKIEGDTGGVFVLVCVGVG